MADFDYAGWASQATKEAEDAAYALNPRGIGSDVKTALKQGLLNLPSAATGLLDIPAGLLGANRPFSTAATKLGELTGIEPAKWAKILDQDYSRATKEGKREIQQVWDDPATSGWDVAKAYASNPRVTGLSAVESLPSMAAGWGVGGVAGKLGGIASASARAAVGEGSVMAGQGMSNISPDVDPQKAALAALAIGAGGAAISGGSANLLGRLGVRDIDTLATGGAQRLASEGVPPMPMYKRVPVGMVQEGLVEEGSQSALETGVQNIAEDKPLTQGMARNVIEGTLAGTPLGAIGGALPPALAKPPMATPEDVAERVAGNKLALEAGKRWQDMVKEKGITAPEDDLATQRSIGLMAQAAADQKQIDEERAGAAAGKARDARLADVGQQFQALNIPDPANELAAQRVGMRPTPTESPYAVAPGRDIFNFPAAPEPAAEPPIPDAAKTLDEAQRVLFGPRGGVAAEAVPPKAPTFEAKMAALEVVLPKILGDAVANGYLTEVEAKWFLDDAAPITTNKQLDAFNQKLSAKLKEAHNVRPAAAVLPPDNAPAVSGAPDVVGGMGSGDGIGFLTSAAQGDVPARVLAPVAGNAGEVSGNAVTEIPLTNQGDANGQEVQKASQATEKVLTPPEPVTEAPAPDYKIVRAVKETDQGQEVTAGWDILNGKDQVERFRTKKEAQAALQELQNDNQQSEPAISATQPANETPAPAETQSTDTAEGAPAATVETPVTPKEQTSVTEANQTEQGQSEKEARETVSADLKRWDEKLGNRLTTSEIVSADPSVKTRETVPTEVNDVKSAIQAVLSLDPLDRTNRDELKLNLNYLAGVAADNKHTFGSSQDLQHIPEVVNDFLDEQEDLAVADGSPLQRMIGRARDRAKTSLAYVISNNEEIKKTDAQKSAELTKAANAVDAGQTLETEFDPSAPFDYGPEVTKELAIKDDAIEVLQRRSDAEPDNTKLAAGLVNARQQRNEYARKEQRRIESDRKASPATTAAGEEITPDMEAEIAARKEATLERQARRLEMGTKGVDIATSNMKPGHLTSLLEHYGIDVSKGVTPEARKTLQTNLRRDVAAYLKDGPEAVPVGIRGAIKAATEDKKGEVRYSKVPKTAAERSTAAEVEADLKDFMKSSSLGRNVTVVQDAGALPAGVAKSVSVDDTTQAFVHNGHAYVIAGNIAKGNARAVFLHDVGGHLGLENILTKNQHRMLVDMVKAWAAREDGSQEHRFAKAALERVASAQTEDSQIGNETLTYFIEEAVQGGVNPTADNFKTELGRWFRVLWAAFKGAIRKLGMNPDKMTSQDIVDMAYGAARMEVHGTWHGTAADFRKFNHDYMGSGEGAQARGWGSYLAQRAGIGKGYWERDVESKTVPEDSKPHLIPNGEPFTKEEQMVVDSIAIGGAIHNKWDAELRKTYLPHYRTALAKAIDENDAYHAGLRTSRRDQTYMIGQFEKLIKGSESLLQPGRVTYTTEGRQKIVPDGNLMRTDVNVADNEWLDLDKKIVDQSDAVKAALNTTKDYTVDSFDKRATGEGVYDYVMEQEFLKKHGRQALDSDLQEAQKLASQYLDSIGIKGNKFLDNPSRHALPGTVESVEYVGPDTRYGGYVSRFGQKLKDFDGDFSAAKAELRDFYETRGDDENVRQVDNTKPEDWKITLRKQAPATHNFVVFNDKNIQRVASLKGADREKVQFSKAIPADRVEMAQKYGGKSGVQVVADTAYTVRKIADWITPLPDLIRKYGVEGKLPTVKEWYAAVQAKEEERNRIKQKAEVIAKIIEPLSDTQRGLLNELGYDSTFQQKWGYDPKFERLNKDGKMEAVKVTVDPEMKARFDKMEKEHPEVIKALKKMFAYGEEVRQDLRSVLRASGLSDSFIVANQLEGPYMPLRRFGNFAVVLKSDKLIAAEAAADGTPPSSAASKLVDKLKMNADDFAFSRFETAGQAAVFLHEQLATGKFNKDKKFSNTFPYGDELNTMTTIPQDVLQRVMAHIKADENMDSDAKKNMVENVKDIYRQTTEDRLARQAQQRRKYRHGADTDMIRSFMAQSEADAGFLSLLKHGGTINDAIYQVQREGEAGRQDLKAISDLIIAHHTEIQKVENTPIQDRLVALTSAMQLASSPSYHLSNMSQVFMVTMPKLAAVFNDYGGSYKAIMEGYKLYREITGGNIITGKTLDLESMTKPEHQGLKEALLHAVRRNLLDVGMDGDISQFNKFQTGYAVADGTSAVASKALYKLRQVSRGVELMNRIATVAASYNMYMERHKGEANAVANAQAFALEMTETTQGDMSNVAAPLALKLTPKVIGQYRKYQIMMVMFYADGFNKAFRSADPKERAIGRRMLAYKMFHTGMAAGVLGLPMINIVGPLFAALFGDDDEPKDFERMMRDTIGNQALADLLLHGPLQMMGLDTSAKLGDEKVFSIMPFTDFDISSKKGLALTTMGLIGGPAFGQASKMADGVGLMQQGAYYKGIEKMLPKGLEDAFKGFRLANEGYALKNGDVMVTAEDINGVALAFQMVGLPSTDIKRMQWFQSQQIEIKKFYTDREADLKRDYLDAKKSGDDTQDIKDDWRQVQEGKAKVRKYFNNVPTEMKARDMSALTDVVNSQHKRELKLQKSIPAAID